MWKQIRDALRPAQPAGRCCADSSKLNPVEAENLLRGIYEHEVINGDGSFTDHIGLPRYASWGQYRRHYDCDGMPDADRAASDLASYPPIAEAIAERLAAS